MPVCTGRGANGDHCCYIEGKVCYYLETVDGIPRCSIWDEMDTVRWRRSKVGKWFAKTYPGYTCRDWPQNIPGLLGRINSGKEDQIDPSAVCCWGVDL